MLPVAAPAGSRHRERSTVAYRPRVYALLAERARREKRPARWEAHKILLDRLVADGEITQELADELWADLTSK